MSRRESHDSSDFYARFVAPALDEHSEPAEQAGIREINEIFIGDARNMAEVPDGSVALVVTSPPYFAGKEYETVVGEGSVPGSYIEYLDMLHDVFADCLRCLEPGGRIAVNVANLGRRPYRSLSADVSAILQDRLQMLLRGEILWQKQRGAAGNCAWGSFQRPGNPVLRDTTERIIVASKGRFDRTPSAAQRQRRGLPHEVSITRDEFMDATLDLWEFPSESATRVGHPAPFPVALPHRLIELHTYVGDLVLDPFMGSGTTAVAATLTGRNWVGYDTEAEYVEAARARVAAVDPAPVPGPRAEAELVDLDLAEALAAGRSAKDVAALSLAAAGASEVVESPRLPAGLEFSFSVDLGGESWLVEVCGTFSTSRGGLNRSEVLWRSLGKVAVARAALPETRIMLLTPSAPGPAALKSLNAVTDAGQVVVVPLGTPDTVEQISALGRP